MAISGDGRTVVGYCSDKPERPAHHVAVVWRDGAAAELGPTVSGAAHSYFFDVSRNGRVMLLAADTGQVASDFNPYRVEDGTNPVLLPHGEEIAIARVFPVALSGDGSVGVGLMELADGTHTGVFWPSVGVAVRLGAFSPDRRINSYGISRDGKTIVGSMAPGNPFAMSVSTLVAEPLTTVRGWASDASGDGAVIVGVLSPAKSGFSGFRWTRDGGMRELGLPYSRIHLADQYSDSFAVAVSANGLTVVGYFWGLESGPALWMQDLPPIDFRAMLRLAGWRSGGVDLISIDGISDDGRTVMGLCVVDGVQKAWIAEIPEICAGDMNFDGLVDDEDFQLFAARYGAWVDFDGSLEEGGIVADGDFNYDGVVDDADFTLFGASYDRLECP